MVEKVFLTFTICISARLAQSVEHETLNLRVVGSSPTLGEQLFYFFANLYVKIEIEIF